MENKWIVLKIKQYFCKKWQEIFNTPNIKQTNAVKVGGILCDEDTGEGILDIGAWRN